jgi:hypothetical protein
LSGACFRSWIQQILNRGRLHIAVTPLRLPAFRSDLIAGALTVGSSPRSNAGI